MILCHAALPLDQEAVPELKIWRERALTAGRQLQQVRAA